MDLVRELKKFSIVPALVLALLSTKVSGQTQSVKELYYPNGFLNAYNNVIISDFRNQLTPTLQGSLITSNNRYIREKFPICSGGEVEFSTKILKNIYANASFGFFNGKSREEIPQEISGSTVGIGAEYYPLKNTKILSIQLGFAYKSQEITGPQNGFPSQVDGIGLYTGIKIEVPIYPNELYLSLGAKGNKIKNMGDSRITAGLKLKLN